MHLLRTRAAALAVLIGFAAPPPVFAGTPTDSTAAATGTIHGRVTDKDGGGPIPFAQISIAGQRGGGLTNNNGEYVIRGVTSGQVTVRATRIGYQPAAQTVTLPDGGNVAVDFGLEKAIARLEEVVTTATGAQSRKEVGNVIASVQAGNIAAVAPVTTAQEVLQARTAGVQVLQTYGQTGMSPAIRIRGNSSLSLSNDPLVIVDGVRYDNSAVSGNFSNSNTATVTHFNEMNPEEIESIDIIKGPSAAALYGTAAANGVIIVKTKRGSAGSKARWTLIGEQGSVMQPSKFGNNYYSWGHNLNSAGQPVGGNVQCRVYNSSAGLCRIDSLTMNNPYTNKLTNPFSKSTPRSQYGLQVSGGSDLLRYFISLVHEGETGPFTMPDTDVKRLTALQGAKPIGTQIHPNQLKQDNVRTNFQIAFAQNATADISVGFLDRTLYTPFDGGYFAGMTFQLMTAPGYVTATNGTQREYVGNIFQVKQYLAEQRLIGSSALNWAPYPWMQVRATVGLDASNVYNERSQLVGQGPNSAAAWGPTSAQGFSGIDENRSNTNKYSTDLGATITRNITANWQSKTTAAAQYFRDELYRSDGQGYGFGPGVSTPNSASQQRASTFTSVNATYGIFGEEQLAYMDKFFVTGGLRQDQNSAFGRSVGNTIYPRGSVSYMISDESWFPRVFTIDKMRLRGAIGQAGVQPSTIAALQYLSATTYPIGGLETPALTLAAVGNPNLKPEVTTEIEVGGEMGLLRDRVNVEFSLYNKLSKDALFQAPLPPSYGAGGTQWQNLAKVQNRGYELTVDANILRSDMLTWDLRVNGSHNKNRLVTAGNVSLSTSPGQRNVVGSPLFGLWDRPILSWKDANGDGIITEKEVTLGDTQVFRGSTLPEYEAGINNRLGFFGDKLSISALLDYRGHYWNQWGYENQRCVSTGNCRAMNDPKAPMDDQAAAVMGASSGNRTLWGFFVQNDFIRFRELSATYSIPEKYTARFFGSHSVTAVLSARNLGVLWTKYPGLDPEASVSNGSGNNDFYAEPLLRYYIGRLNVTF